MAIGDDSYYTCLCGIHVHRAAYLISIFGMVFQSISLIGHLISKELGFALGALISLVCYACVFYANKYERPNYYLPHLGLNFISLIFNIIGYVILLVAVIVAIFEAPKSGEAEGKSKSEIAIGGTLFMIVLLVLYLIQVYFVYVVYRARHYMIHVLQKPSGVPHFTQSGMTTTVNNIL